MCGGPAAGTWVAGEGRGAAANSPGTDSATTANRPFRASLDELTVYTSQLSTTRHRVPLLDPLTRCRIGGPAARPLREHRRAPPRLGERATPGTLGRSGSRARQLHDPAPTTPEEHHVKPDIHPTYVETQVTCTCGNTFVTRSTAANGVIHADVCSACHPFYTGKQKILDTGGRVARFEKRFGKTQRRPTADRPTPSSSADGAAPDPGCGAVRHPGPTARPAPGRPTETTMFEHVEDLVAEYADLELRLADPAIHADQAEARRLGRRYAAARAGRRTSTGSGARSATTSARPRSSPARTRPSPPRPRRSTARRAELADDLAILLRAARPRRRPRRHPRGQGGGGRRRVGAVRRRPAADVPALRRASRLEDRGARQPGVRPRRLQGRLGGRQGAGPTSSTGTRPGRG